MKKSIMEQIYELMKAEPECTIFVVDDFVDRFDEEVIRKSLTRLAKDGKITRLMNGYFTIPYFIKCIGEYSYPTDEDLAKKIAERYGWKILPTKETVLNYLGLSTQMPYTTEYISTGPYREFIYEDILIKFNHTDHLQPLQCSEPLAMVIQAIKEIGKNKMTEYEFLKLCEYCKKNVDEDINHAVKVAPGWIRKILKKIDKEIKNEQIPSYGRRRASISNN